jgi:hypothetical protein
MRIETVPYTLISLHSGSISPIYRIPWQPLVEGEDADRVRGAVEEIAEALRGDPQNQTQPGLCDGSAGRALFFSYMAEAWPGRGYEELAGRYYDRTVELLESAPPRVDFFDGIPGIAWVSEHVWGRFNDPGAEDANESVDELMLELLGQSPWPYQYDLVSGLAGHGTYAIERLPRASGAECLALVVDRLAEESERRDGGVTWLSKPCFLPPHQLEQSPNGYYNLGVAHGVPAVIAVLAAASAAGIRPEKSEPLFREAVAWLLAQRLGKGSPSAFPCWVQEGLLEGPARAAWCYGDPGLAATLYAAARIVGDARLEGEALGIARRAAQRPLESCGVFDTGLCHGSTGLAHIYNRLWQETGDEVFAQAARRWVYATLWLRRPGRGIAGFRTWYPQAWGDRPAGWDEGDSSLLTGAVGIGLALLATISSVEAAWDRALLASLPTVS